jgi:hypothetical protein
LIVSGSKDGNRGLVVNCYRNSGAAGCSRADILASLQQRGLYDPKADEPIEPDPEELARRAAADEANRQARIARARWLWQEETRAAGGTVQVYLWSRLLLIDPIPDVIRFHPSLYHKESGECRPAMIARIDHGASGDGLGVHATYLAMDGSSKATLKPERRIIGTASGGAVQLGQPQRDRRLIVGEGIENAIALGLSLRAPAWAALGAPGLRSLALPPKANIITIAADHDKAGIKAARIAAKRWVAEGREVEICIPPVPGTDWNDALLHPALRRGL